jgi:hypothetical protein
MILIGGVTIRGVWTGIMRRSDDILLCCPDEEHAGIHIIGKHYFSGGDSGDGYDSFHHYYIRLSDGHMFLSKKLDDKSSHEKSLRDLSEKVKASLKPRISSKVEIGSYQDENEKTFEKIMKLPQGIVKIKSFNWLIDYGFRISFYDTNQRLRWKRIV